MRGHTHSRVRLEIAARDARKGTERIDRLARPALEPVRLHFPAGLAAALRANVGAAWQALASDCETHRVAWEQGRSRAEGRREARERVFAHARSLGNLQRRALVALADDVGTVTDLMDPAGLAVPVRLATSLPAHCRQAPLKSTGGRHR